MISTVRPAGSALVPDARRWIAPALSAIVVAAALVLLWRRLAGALVEPLSAGLLFPLGITLAAWAALARRSSLYSLSIVGKDGEGGDAGSEVRSLSRAADWLARHAWPTALALAIAAALSVRGTSAIGLAVLWGLPLVELGWHAVGQSPRRTLRSTGAPPSAPIKPSEVCDAATAADALTQRWERRRLDDGGETLSGWLLVELAAGQRSATAHVAFCPALPHAPEVEAALVDGPEGTVEAAQVLPWGARLELRLARAAAEPTAARIELVAHAAAPQS